MTEARAAGEGTTTAGGYLVPPGFADEVIRYVKEFDSILADFEDVPTDKGNPWQRPQVSSFTASGATRSSQTHLRATLNCVLELDSNGIAQPCVVWLKTDVKIEDPALSRRAAELAARHGLPGGLG